MDHIPIKSPSKSRLKPCRPLVIENARLASLNQTECSKRTAIQVIGLGNCVCVDDVVVK